MKKAVKKVFASLLVAVMVLTAAPLNGFVGLKINFDWLNFNTKSSALSSSGNCGKNVTYTFNESTGELVISGKGVMYDYSDGASISPFYNNILIKSVVINKGVTKIGSYAFWDCKGLKALTILDSVTSIGDETFYNCKGLTTLTIPDSITSIGEGAFYNCTGLTRVNISSVAAWCNIQFSGEYSNPLYNSSSNLFLNGEFVTELIIPDSVTNIGHTAFENCTSIKQLKYNAVNCQSGANVFRNSGIEAVTVSSSVQSIPDKLFAECPNLKNIIFESDGYIEMGNDVFLNSYDAVICCKENSYMHFYAETMGLKYCILDDSNNPSFTVKNDILTKYNGSAESVFVSSASQIGFGAFSGNENVKSVELASNVIRIFSQAFKNCTNLENVIIQKNVSSIGDDAFEGCNNLVIWCYADSYAESYALSHYIPVKYITLELSQPVVTLETNGTAILCASFSTVLTEENQLKWISDNPDVVTVTEDGKITAIGVGEATLTAISSNGLSANCLVKVTKTDTPEQKGKVKSVSVDNISLDYKAKGKLNPVIEADSGVKYKVEYKSSNTSIVTVDNNGTVYAAKKGNATITCTITDEYGNQASDTCNVTVGYAWWQWIIKIVLFGWIWY